MWQLSLIQSLSGETLRLASVNVNNGAKLDIWNVGEDTFFDVRVFHPNAPSNRSGRLSAVYKRHEEESILSENLGRRAWHVHPTYSVKNRSHGEKSTNLLQAPSRHAFQQKRSSLQHAYGLAQMQTLLRHLQICRDVHQRKQILLAQSHQGCYRHSPCLHGGLCAPAVVTEITKINLHFHSFSHIPS